jgi:hypothetical protein
VREELSNMPYDSLDSLLESGIAAICDGDWATAQSLLGERLEDSFRLGRRRLNLFLLSVVAARSGLANISEQLAQDARQVPLEMGEPRYLGHSDDPVRRELENQWWSFNGWLALAEEPVLPIGSAGEEELNWASVLDGAVEGRAGEMERRWSRFLEGAGPERPILWNLLALSYLESGDLRTYEEMRDEAAPEAPREVPTELAALLEQAGLRGALSDLRQGRWLTAESLHDTLSAGALERSAEELVESAWENEMAESFLLLSVGRAAEAARKLGSLSLQGSPWHRAYALNALALALFSCGEYAGAEEALAEGHREAAQAPPGGGPELARCFAEWLDSVGVQPVPGSPFCDPFRQSTPGWGEPEGTSPSEDSGAFWPLFEEALEGMRGGNLSACHQTLRRLLSEPSGKECTRAFLTSLLFAGVALLEGDHMEAQDSIDEASRLLSAGGFQSGQLVEAQGRLAAAGAMTLASKMELEALSSLDPWRDFPADFPQQSFSGF